MKNLKIAMILVAAVAFFCSCGEKTVTVDMTCETINYDLSSAATMPVSVICTVKADAGIKTIEVSKVVKNGEDVVTTTAYEFESSEYEGMAEYTFEIPDTLVKANLAAGYTVDYSVVAADKKDNQGSKTHTITITQTATPIAAEWSENIILGNQSWANYNGVTCKAKDETIGVEAVGQDGNANYKAKPTTGASWVFVESIENLTSNEALVEAFNNGTPVTGEYEFPTTNLGKSHPYSELYFVSHNAAGEYVLVDYVAGQNSTTTGNVLVFKYKKAETPAPAAK